MGKNIARAFGDIFRIPSENRHELEQYNLPHIRPMKGSQQTIQVADDHIDEEITAENEPKELD